MMKAYRITLAIAVLFVVLGSAGCWSGSAQNNTASTISSNSTPSPAARPRTDFSPADIAKLKWIEGTWRGMDGDKPFYERYKLEGTTLIVEGLKEDGSADGDPGRFELKNGEFGKGEGDRRSAASEITDKSIQFVPGSTPTPAGPARNSFRFEDQRDGTWTATLEWPATADKPARQKIYKMEPWKPKK